MVKFTKERLAWDNSWTGNNSCSVLSRLLYCEVAFEEHGRPVVFFFVFLEVTRPLKKWGDMSPHPSATPMRPCWLYVMYNLSWHAFGLNQEAHLRLSLLIEPPPHLRLSLLIEPPPHLRLIEMSRPIISGGPPTSTVFGSSASLPPLFGGGGGLVCDLVGNADLLSDHFASK